MIDPGEFRYCQHALCKAHAADELKYLLHVPRHALANRLDWREPLRAGVEVVCRRRPRKGPIRAPLPDEIGHELMEET